jgi:mono/diheme cytochrome c family protein
MRMQRTIILIFAGLGLIAAGILGWRYFGTETAAVWADPDNPVLVARGGEIYRDHCASCHGKRLEGQPDWRRRRSNGRLPAPPHDPTGHTWHHPDKQLFDIIKHGTAAYAPPGYQTDMGAYKDTLADRDIWSVLAYIKAQWPEAIQDRQARIDARSKAQPR